MDTVEINISIPINKGASAELILRLIRDTLEERFQEVDDIGNELDDGETETIADTHGFGGNTITLYAEDSFVEEICL
jgi:hypothetical protein